MSFRMIAPALLLWPALAAAEPLRPYCPERPGLGTPACIVDAGHVSLETGLLAWTRERDDGVRTDSWLAGDAQLRVGIGGTAEVQLGWTAYGRERRREGGQVEHAPGTGDIRIAAKASLANPDGLGAALALLPFATIPVGSGPAGAEDWGAGLTLPGTVALSDRVMLGFTGQVEAAVNESGHGRHLAYGGVGGVTVTPTDALSITAELGVTRDRAPDDRHTETLGALSLGWLVSQDLEFDMGANAGLNHDAPGLELYVGVSRRF